MQSPPSSQSTLDEIASQLKCHCNQPVVTRVSGKSYSLGRKFAVCPKNSADKTKCEYFQWLDTLSGPAIGPRSSLSQMPSSTPPSRVVPDPRSPPKTTPAKRASRLAKISAALDNTTTTPDPIPAPAFAVPSTNKGKGKAPVDQDSDTEAELTDSEGDRARQERFPKDKGASFSFSRPGSQSTPIRPSSSVTPARSYSTLASPATQETPAAPSRTSPKRKHDEIIGSEHNLFSPVPGSSLRADNDPAVRASLATMQSQIKEMLSVNEQQARDIAELQLHVKKLQKRVNVQDATITALKQSILSEAEG